VGGQGAKEQAQWLYLVLALMVQQQVSPAASASLVLVVESLVALAFHAA
jgi:hypothetical protein